MDKLPVTPRRNISQLRVRPHPNSTSSPLKNVTTAEASGHGPQLISDMYAAHEKRQSLALVQLQEQARKKVEQQVEARKEADKQLANRQNMLLAAVKPDAPNITSENRAYMSQINEELDHCPLSLQRYVEQLQKDYFTAVVSHHAAAKQREQYSQACARHKEALEREVAQHRQSIIAHQQAVAAHRQAVAQATADKQVFAAWKRNLQEMGLMGWVEMGVTMDARLRQMDTMPQMSSTSLDPDVPTDLNVGTSAGMNAGLGLGWDMDMGNGSVFGMGNGHQNDLASEYGIFGVEETGGINTTGSDMIGTTRLDPAWFMAE